MKQFLRLDVPKIPPVFTKTCPKQPSLLYFDFHISKIVPATLFGEHQGLGATIIFYPVLSDNRREILSLQKDRTHGQ